MKSFSRILIFFVITVKLVFSQVSPIVIPPPGDDINTNPDPRCSIGKCDTVRVQARRIQKREITFDGKLDETFWKLGNKFKLNPNFTNSNIPNMFNDITFSSVWDEDYLYIGFKVIDNEIVRSNWGGVYSYGNSKYSITPEVDPENFSNYSYPPYFSDAMEVFISNSNQLVRNKTNIIRLSKPISENDLWSERTPELMDSSYFARVSTFTGGYTMEFKFNFDEIDRIARVTDFKGGYNNRRFKIDITNHDMDPNVQSNFSYTSNWSNFCDNLNFTSNEYYGVVELVDSRPEDDYPTLTILGPTFFCNPSKADYQVISSFNVPYEWSVSSGGVFTDEKFDFPPYRSYEELEEALKNPDMPSHVRDSLFKVMNDSLIRIYPKIGFSVNVEWYRRGNFTLTASPTPKCPLDDKSVSIQVRIGGIPPLINGASVVCPGKENLDYTLINTFSGYSYLWSVVGSTMIKDTSMYRRTINWGDKLGKPYFISVTPTDENGCIGGTNYFKINLNPLLRTSNIYGDSVLCSDYAVNIPFRTGYQEGLKYTWKVEGGEVTSQTGINKALISFIDMESFVYYILSDSTPSYVCEGISKKKKVLVNFPPESPEQIYLFQITTNYENDNLIELKWYLNNRYTYDSLRVFRSVNGSLFDDFKRVPRLNTGFKDLVEDTRANTYQYYLANTLKCNYGVVSPKAGIMNLTAVRQENTENIKLSWSPYNYWLKGLKHYAVYEKIDNGDTNLLAYTTNTEFNCFKKGFEHEYRILAIANEGFTITPVLTSWSNKAFLNFDNPVIAVNNVITPNGDQKNEYFTIENLKPYPQKRVQIFNRYGSLIYESENYNNDWNGGNLSEGIYFYLIEYGRNSLSQKLNGYIQILK